MSVQEPIVKHRIDGILFFADVLWAHNAVVKILFV